MCVIQILCALSIVVPKDGTVVPTLRDGQKVYFEERRSERFVRMDNPADRAKLVAIGATQRPLKLVWSGATNAVYALTVEAEEGGAHAGPLLRFVNDVAEAVERAATGRSPGWPSSSAAASPSTAP